VGVISACPIGLEDRAINSIAPPRSSDKSLRSLGHGPIKNANKRAPTEITAPIGTCQEEISLIGDYLSDNLSAANRHTFAEHLELCPDCAAFLTTYKKTIDITRNYLNFAVAQDQTPKLTLRAPSAAERWH
jgi:hypothetical protein